MKMKFKENVNYIEFLKDVKKCSKDVYIETVEGDKLNLNSALSQYVFAVASVQQQMAEYCTVLCEESDMEVLGKYIR